VDEEAVSEMLERVGNPDTLALLGDRAPTLVVRTLWSIAQARAVAPQDAALARLAAAASPALAPALRVTGARSPTGSPVSASRAAAAYLALLAELPAELRPTGLDGLSGGEGGKALLEALGRGPVGGDDDAVLGGLAHRLAGTEAWNAARDQRAEMAGQARVSAGALRVLNRLERARLAGLPAPPRP
jgi:hypothetical protein